MSTRKTPSFKPTKNTGNKKTPAKAFGTNKDDIRSETAGKSFVQDEKKKNPVKKVTFDLDRKLANDFKRFAAANGQPMKYYIENFLKQLLKDDF